MSKRSEAKRKKNRTTAQNQCRNAKEIIEFATKRGLKNVHLIKDLSFGWSLHGDGLDKENRWPLVWEVARECGITWGGGQSDSHQIRPELFADAD